MYVMASTKSSQTIDRISKHVCTLDEWLGRLVIDLYCYVFRAGVSLSLRQDKTGPVTTLPTLI